MSLRCSHRHFAATLAAVGASAALGLATTAVAATTTSSTTAKPTLTSPPSATVGDKVTVKVYALVHARYQLYLAYTQKVSQGGHPVNCIAPIGSVTTVKKATTLSGTVPSKLACSTDTGKAEGSVPVTTGRYDIVVGSPLDNGFNEADSVLQHSIQIAG